MCKVRLFIVNPMPEDGYEDTIDMDLPHQPHLGEEIIVPNAGYSYTVIRVIHYPEAPRPMHLHVERFQW